MGTRHDHPSWVALLSCYRSWLWCLHCICDCWVLLPKIVPNRTMWLVEGLGNPSHKSAPFASVSRSCARIA
jgi:hypothetical protein